LELVGSECAIDCTLNNGWVDFFQKATDGAGKTGRKDRLPGASVIGKASMALDAVQLAIVQTKIANMAERVAQEWAQAAHDIFVKYDAILQKRTLPEHKRPADDARALARARAVVTNVNEDEAAKFSERVCAQVAEVMVIRIMAADQEAKGKLLQSATTNGLHRIRKNRQSARVAPDNGGGKGKRHATQGSRRNSGAAGKGSGTGSRAKTHEKRSTVGNRTKSGDNKISKGTAGKSARKAPAAPASSKRSDGNGRSPMKQECNSRPGTPQKAHQASDSRRPRTKKGTAGKSEKKAPAAPASSKQSDRSRRNAKNKQRNARLATLHTAQRASGSQRPNNHVGHHQPTRHGHGKRRGR